MQWEDEPESIYRLIPKPPPVVVKEPLYVSKFHGSTAFNTAKTRAHATMGETAEQMHRDPKDFLKKRSGRQDLPPRPVVSSHGNATLRRPPVPRAATRRSAPATPAKDFVLENWRSAPHTKQLHPEVPEVRYTQKRDFGKAPRYLNRVKREVADESAYWQGVRETMLPEDEEPRCRLVPEEERLEILGGLMANLADVRKRYTALPMGEDNIGFRQRKARMEQEMTQLERDIATFSRQSVYITEN
jgi:hypothetical protein